MGNRKQPFGYRMEMGEIVIHLQEARVVRFIYREYIAGVTFNRLVNALRNQDIPYDNGKLWNKNMVARILGDRRYVGENGYPVIITLEDMDSVQRIRDAKQVPIQKTAAQKLIRRLSGHTATSHMEMQVMSLLNSVIGKPDKIRQMPGEDTHDASEMIQNQLDAVMLVQPIDEGKAKELILQLASDRYEAIDSGEYETQRLQRIFESAVPMNELNAELLQKTVSDIKIAGNGTVSLRLKNNQTLGGEFL